MHLTDSLAAELGGNGVLAFAISPGFVAHRPVEGMVATSETGRRFCRELAERDDAVDPAEAGRLVVEIASGKLDALAGRFLHVLDDADDLLRRLDEITADDLYALRLRRLDAAE